MSQKKFYFKSSYTMNLQSEVTCYSDMLLTVLAMMYILWNSQYKGAFLAFTYFMHKPQNESNCWQWKQTNRDLTISTHVLVWNSPL